MIPTLAAVVTVPGRPVGRVLAALRPQVDILAVYCNFEPVPTAVARVADWTACDPSGALRDLRKTFWTTRWRGVYLTCDDDIAYPPDYVQAMVSQVIRFRRQAVVTAHSRRFQGRATAWGDYQARAPYWRAYRGAWANWPGTGVAAWHTDLGVPQTWPDSHLPNLDGHLARWCQERQVPIWSLKRPAGWITPLQESGGLHEADKHLGYPVATAHLRQVSDWVVYTDPRKRTAPRA